MTQTTKPPKHLTREYLERRVHAEDPPPSLEEIRRLLGWHLIPNNGPVPEVSD
ncbi:hypothetical protein BN2497_2559 [Janthinobacterium sp. CG23_2]|nr:hypothetical protein BN2497_35 [Janthinobacterium sp. CG23_2]CUI03891.1 hypothetical protein BN2497_2559 [Janthinobacterium sp. CG23_2]CUU26415.1 hypothetical protein BN3177_35 [Janthinobacterium sp. CG23_2]CUU27677.1 hypothetical protein BN3177_2559 [Janthinobacterium sp. CG23_2]